MYLEIGLGTVILIEGYVVWNLIRKTELLETWVENFSQVIQNVENELTQIDARGSFESDDETGAIFKQIKETVKQLESYKGEEE